MERHHRAALGALAAPVLYALALVVVATVASVDLPTILRDQRTGPALEPPVVLAVVGALAVLAREAGARLASALGILGPVAVAWDLVVFPAGFTDGGNAAIVLLLGTLVVAAVETARSDPSLPGRLLGDDDVRLGLAVGALHLALAIAAWTVVRGGHLYLGPLYGPAWIGSTVGLVATGAFPVVALRRWRLRLPALALVGWLAWAVVDLWPMRETLPLTAFRAVRFSGVPPAPDYAVSWPPLVVVLLLAAGSEWWLRQVLGS